MVYGEFGVTAGVQGALTDGTPSALYDEHLVVLDVTYASASVAHLLDGALFALFPSGRGLTLIMKVEFVDGLLSTTESALAYGLIHQVSPVSSALAPYGFRLVVEPSCLAVRLGC